MNTVYEPKLFPGSSHYWALGVLKALPPTSVIIDIGVGSGVIGEQLANMKFSVFGVEPNEHRRSAALKFYQHIAEQPDALATPERGVLCLLDVLEHTPNPEEFLTSLCNRFQPKRVLISVPNVTHWSLRLGMLFGFFEYTSRGLLDQTHLQLFSRRRIEGLHQLMASMKYRRRTLSGSIAPLELLNLPIPSPLFAHSFRKFWANLWPSLFAYQYLMEFECLD